MPPLPIFWRHAVPPEIFPKIFFVVEIVSKMNIVVGKVVVWNFCDDRERTDDAFIRLSDF